MRKLYEKFGFMRTRDGGFASIRGRKKGKRKVTRLRATIRKDGKPHHTIILRG